MHRYRGTEVAVKRLIHQPDAAREQAVSAFRKEMTMMTRLRHPNIVLFMGLVEDPLCMVTEYCGRGNLFALLHTSATLPWVQRVRMALDAAKGMNCRWIADDCTMLVMHATHASVHWCLPAVLHKSKPTIIHRDLKSLNLLVDDSMAVKVADFGLSRFKASSASRFMTAQAGSWHWMAPGTCGGNMQPRVEALVP